MQTSSQKKQAVKVNRQITIFLVCIFISTILWLLISLSASNNTYIEVPVKYEGVENVKTIINKLPTHLKLRVTTSEFKILMKKYFFGNDTIHIQATSLNLERSRNKAYILTKEIQSEIEEQLNPHLKVLSVLPDTIRLYFDKKIEKKIPVKLITQISFDQQYQLADSIKVNPDSITISGAEKLLRNVKYIETFPLQLISLKESVRTSVPLNKASMLDSTQAVNYDTSRIELSSINVNATISVEKYTESIVEVNVVPKDFPLSYLVVCSPSKVKVKYQVSFSDYEKIKPEMFVACITYTDSKLPHAGKLAVELVKKPDFIKVTRIEPEKVNYILRTISHN